MKRAPRDPEPAKRWFAFLRNHREAIAAMDLFTTPTVNFRILYCFFIIWHDRRQILHFNVTRHPTSLWIVQQLREASFYQSAPRFLIFDRDAKYGLEVPIELIERTKNGPLAKILSYFRHALNRPDHGSGDPHSMAFQIQPLQTKRSFWRW
jgi:hypothetical protein